MTSSESQGGTGNARSNTTDTPEECNKRGASKLSKVLLEWYGTQSIKRVAFGDRHKTTERPPQHTSLLYVHYISSVLSTIRDYAIKIDLEDAYFHIPIHPDSRKYLHFTYEIVGQNIRAYYLTEPGSRYNKHILAEYCSRDVAEHESK